MATLFDVVTPKKVKFVYSDKGTGAHQDLSVFEPDLDYVPDGFYTIGQVAVREHQQTTPPSSMFLVKPANGAEGIFKQPVAYELKWNDKKSGGDYDGTFWRVVAPDGYVALGDVVTRGYSEPSLQWTKKYACIRNDLTSEGSFGDEALWLDKGSGAHKDGSLWEVRNADPCPSGLAGFFKVQDGHDKPFVPCRVLTAKVTHA